MAVLSNTGIRAGASAAGGGAYQIEKSLRFEPGDTAHLTKTPSSEGNRKTWTWSGWVKRSGFTNYQNIFAAGTNIFNGGSGGQHSTVCFDSTHHIQHYNYEGGYGYYQQSEAEYRDPSAWMHIVAILDTTNATAADRAIVYVNGERMAIKSGDVQPTQNTDYSINKDHAHYLGLNTGDTLNGYMADVHFIDGQALDASSFGETDEDTGQWVPKEYAGTYGTNGFYLKFNGTDLGEDSSGNDNDWTANNLTAASTNFDVPCVSFDGTDDYLELADSTDFDFGTSDFTLECFVNPDSPGSNAYQSLVMKADAGTTYAGSSWWWALYSYAAGTSLSYCYIYDGSTYKVLQGSSLPNGKWHHIAVVRDGDTARLYHNGVQVDSLSVSGWTQNSCSNTVRIGSDGGANYDMDGAISNVRIVNGTCLYPSGTTFTVPSRPLANVTNTKLLCCQSSTQASAATVAHTVSGSINDGTGWSDLVEGTLNSEYSSSDRSVIFNGTAWGSSLSNTIRPNAGNLLEIDFGTRFNSATSVKITGQASLDGTTYTGTNENLEINGTAISASAWDDNGGSGAGAAGSATFSLSSGLQKIGWGYDYGSASSGYLYLAAIEVDGVELKNPLIPSGSMNAFEGATTKSDNTIGDDVTNDSPTNFDDGGNGTGNYCTFNPLWQGLGGNSPYTLAQGNLRVENITNAYGYIDSTIYLKTGKWYAEMTTETGTLNAYDYIGIVADTATPTDIPGNVVGYWYKPNGNKVDNNGWSGSAYGATYVTGDCIGIAFDLDSGSITFYKNGVSQGVAFSNIDTTKSYAVAWGDYANAQTCQYVHLNCGQRAFKYTPPTGYKAINTYNLPDPTIKDPKKYFDTKLYTGTGASSHAITGLNFSPDLVWIKKYTSASHAVFDTIRGATYRLKTDSTAAVDWDNTTLSAFGTEGFTLSTNNDVNQNTDSYVSWNWDAGTANKVNTEIDQSQDWSSTSNLGGSSTTAANAFLGYNFLSGSGTVAYDNTGNNVLTTAPLSGVTKLEIMTNRTHSGTTDGTKITIDGTAYYDKALAANGWSEVDLGGATISNTSGDSIYIEDEGGSASTLWGVRVNGKVLVDSGNSLASVPSLYAGGLNSTVYDQSKTWSDESHSSTGGIWSTPPNSESLTTANLFDGSLSTYAGPYSGGTMTVSFGQTFSGTKTYSVYWYAWDDGETIKDQDGNTLYTPASGDVGLYQNQWHEFQGTDVSSLKFTSTTSANASGVYSIKVDGKELLDPTVSISDYPTTASTYRANPDAGFSIVSYTGNNTAGDTIAHGLNAVPSFMIVKEREGSSGWVVYHKEDGGTKYLYLNDYAATATSSSPWNDTDPTSTVLSVGSWSGTNGTTDHIAYCWSEVERYSKFGTYEGNGSADGPFVPCGFKPALLIIKKTNSVGHWLLLDNERDPYNVADNKLAADLSDAENGTNVGGDTLNAVDFLSNGFKLRSTTGSSNSDNDTFIFAAFAETPFKYSNAR